MIFSVMRDRTKVTDIGRKSLGCFGFAVLGTGQILARFHCVGTVDVLIGRLMRSARVLLNIITFDSDTTVHMTEKRTD